MRYIGRVIEAVSSRTCASSEARSAGQSSRMRQAAESSGFISSACSSSSNPSSLRGGAALLLFQNLDELALLGDLLVEARRLQREAL